MSEVISAFISSIILLITIFVFTKIVTKEKIDYKSLKTILVFLIFAILHTVIYILSKGTIKTILILILYTVFIKILFNKKIESCIFMSIIYIILTIIPELIITTSFILLFGKASFYTYFAGSIVCNICVCGLMLLLTHLIKKPLRKIVDYKISTSKKIIIMSILAILFVILFFYKFDKGSRTNQDVALYLLALLAFVVILLSLIKEKIDNENITKRYDDLLTVMKEYETDIEKQRSTMHENKNELMTIKSKINSREKEAEVLRYIDSIIGDKVTKGKTKYSKFKYLPSNGLKGFFYYKVLEAGEKDIDTTVNVSKQIENCFLKDLKTNDFKQLARLIGVYLDNAIEASAASDKKLLGIEVYLINGNAKIIISNTYANDIDLDKMGKERYSTKGKNRGHGLLLVEMILSKSDIFEAKTKVTDELYIQELTIKNKTNQEKDAK